jgi:hypothetical protein
MSKTFNFWGLLREMVPNGRKRSEYFFYLAIHLKTVLGTRINHRNLNRTYGEGVDNNGIVHSTTFY